MKLRESLPPHVIYHIMSYIPVYDLTRLKIRVQKRKIQYRKIVGQITSMISPVHQKEIMRYLMDEIPSLSFLKDGFVYRRDDIYLHLESNDEYILILT